MADFGRLNDYIIGAAVKRLSDVELKKQHELNGVTSLKYLFGALPENEKIEADFIRLDDNEEDIERAAGQLTWYDSRKNKPRSAEYRCYYTDNPAIAQASPGDPVALILKKDNSIVFVTAPKGSQSELDLFELFGENFRDEFQAIDLSTNYDELGVAKRYILQELGIELKASFGKNYLDLISAKFGKLSFPKSKEFSAFARELTGALTDYSTSDEAVVAWWDVEEAMFYQLEAYEIGRRLSEGFKDVPDFLKYSTSVRQRRVSRAGNALENHLASVFDERGVRYSWGKITEKNKTPDFIFPGILEYGNPIFLNSNLTILGVKATCKDRWRQVLSEAKRIEKKHLFTLQPKISENQTEEMIDSKLQLVVPTPIHNSYTEKQRNWLWSFEQFIERVSGIL